VVAQAPAEQVPLLTVQDVREKWEYIKRRVRSKSAKDGSLVQALLNDYTVLAIEGTREQPVVVLRAGAEFHFKQLQNNDERRKIIEWALKVELQQECRVKLVSPSHVGPSMTIPPPSSDGSGGSSLFSSMLAMPRSSAFQERPPAEKPPSARSYPASQSEAVVSPSVALAPARDVQKLASTPQARSTSSPSAPPLARTHVVRENTTEGTIRAEESRVNHQTRVEQHAKGDPVVQEVLRLFKAEIKEIRSK
jgi:hypothetical protein